MRSIRIALLASFLLEFAAFAGGGHVDRGGGHVDFAPQVKLESVNPDGKSNLLIQGTVISPDEIKLLDLGRQSLANEYGAEALNWPLMVNIESRTATFFDKIQNRYRTLNFGQ